MVVSSLMMLFVFTTYGNRPVKYVTLQVEAGQTLWNIAKNYCSNNEDPRKMVFMIKKANNLQDSIIRPGQQLKIPVNDV